MRTLLFKYALVLCLTIPLATMANDEQSKGKYNKEKTINKEFDVNPTDLLKVKNRYGNVTISSWDEDRIVMEIKIKVSGNNEDKVQKKLDLSLIHI